MWIIDSNEFVLQWAEHGAIFLKYVHHDISILGKLVDMEHVV